MKDAYLVWCGMVIADGLSGDAHGGCSCLDSKERQVVSPEDWAGGRSERTAMEFADRASARKR